MENSVRNIKIYIDIFFLTMPLEHRLSASAALLRRISPVSVTGTIVALQGLLAEVGGLTGLLAIGDRLHLRARDGRIIPAEVTGFRHDLAQSMAFAPLEGLGPRIEGGNPHAIPCPARRCVGLAGPVARSARCAARWQRSAARRHDAAADAGRPARSDVAGTRWTTHRSGVRALNCFATCREGQRLGCSPDPASASQACCQC